MIRWWIAFLCLVSGAYGCKCAEPAPESCRWSQPSSVVFVGTVLSVDNPSKAEEERPLRDDGTGVAHYRFHVDEAFFGTHSSEIDVYSGRGGADCSFHFKAGHQYLVFPYHNKDGRLFATFCNQTRGYSATDPLISELRAARDHKPVASVFGTLERAVEPYSGPYQTEPLPQIEVRLTGEGQSQTFRAITDADGVYRVYGVPAGKFKVSANLPRTLQLTGPYADELGTLEFPANACYEQSLLAQPATSIHGHVLDESGAVVRGAVELLRGDSYVPDSSGPWDISGEDGFEFKNIAPGSYILVFNKDDELDPSAPYPRTFFPGVIDPRKAAPIVLGEGQSYTADIHVSGGAPTRRLTVTLVWANGAVVKTKHAVVWAKPAAGQETSGERLQDGVFSLRLLEGKRYEVWGNVACPCASSDCRTNWVDTPKTEVDVSESLGTSLRLSMPPDVCRE